MSIVRELVTLLRYQVDESGLKKYQERYQAARTAMAQASDRAGQTLRQAAAGSGLAGLAARARGAMHTVREVGIGAWEGVRLGIQDARQAQEKLNGSVIRGARLAREQAGAFSGLRGILGAVFGVAVLQRIGADIDAWGQMEARMRQATASAHEYAQVDQDLARISRLTYKSYQSSAELFVRTRRTMADLGKSTQDTVDVTEALSLGMALSSTKAQDQESVISSLTKAIMQGKLGMDEYATLMRAAPRLQVALADGLGITTAALLEQVKAGSITTNKFLPALQAQLAKMRIEAEAMPVTVADAMTVWNDAFERFFGKTLTAGRVAVLGLTNTIEFLADNIETIIKLLAISGGAWGLVRLRNWMALVTMQSGGLMRSLVATTRAALRLDSAMALRRGPAGALQMLTLWRRSLAPLLRMAAILYTIYLLVDDIAVWYRGGDSALGDLIGPSQEWKEQIEGVKNALIWVKNELGGAGQELGPWIRKWGTILIMLYGVWRILSPVRGLIMFLARTAVPLLWRAFAMTPIGRIVTLVAAGLWLIWSNWSSIVKFFTESWTRIKSAAKGSFMEPVIEYIEAIWNFWADILKGVIAAFTGDWDGAVAHWRSAFEGIWKFFSDIGGRMIAKIQEIGGAITTWITGKIEAAAKWLNDLLPGDMLSDEQRAAMAGPKGLLGGQQQWQAFASGAGVPVVSAGATVRAGAGGARGPVTIENRNEININAPGSDPQAVASAASRGLATTQRRSNDAMARFFEFSTGVEAPAQ